MHILSKSVYIEPSFLKIKLLVDASNLQRPTEDMVEWELFW